MKLSKENVCVFIKDEAHLKEARELLERYDQEHNFIYLPEEDNVLCLSGCKYWGVYGYKTDKETIIELSKLEEILKSEV